MACTRAGDSGTWLLPTLLAFMSPAPAADEATAMGAAGVHLSSVCVLNARRVMILLQPGQQTVASLPSGLGCGGIATRGMHVPAVGRYASPTRMATDEGAACILPPRGDLARDRPALDGVGEPCLEWPAISRVGV